MTNEQYIAALKQALSGLAGNQRDEILREIESHLADLPESETLESRFGSVEELANQYLDGQPLPATLPQKLGKAGRLTLIGVGGIALVLVLLVSLLAWLFGGDKFDYADESAPAREIAAEEWSSIDWRGPITLRVEQAHAVVYWHDRQQIRWHCKGRDDLDPAQGREMLVRHGYCILYLPPLASEVEALQSDLVLVRPGAPVSIDLRQAELRIASLGESYRYDLNLTNSNSEAIDSDDNAATIIAINATESNIGTYEYR